ncbi:MAG: hypothetical protein LBN99_05655 [Oscillospiraceae bacterium]|jgi:hypothetical protein|nr:hypothetical protein [Oscillospiraceae bacterium]
MHEHEHEHEHHHDHDHDHEHEHHHHDHEHDAVTSSAPGVIEVEVTEHEEAIIASGALTLVCPDAEIVKTALGREIDKIALAVDNAGGIVGHVKASLISSTVDMLSATEPGVAAQIKRSPDAECAINLVAIVFAVEPDFAEKLVREALQAILNIL